MKFGRVVWYGDRPFEKTIKNICRAGFEYIELSLDYPVFEMLQMDKERTEKMKKLLRDADMGIAFHCPYSGVEILHPRKIISEAGFVLVERIVKFVRQFNPIYFNIHLCGRIPTFRFKEIREEIYDNSISAGQWLEKLGEKCDINIVVENEPGFPFCFLNNFKFLFAGVRGINMCFDVGHVVLSNKWADETEIEELIKEKREIRDWLRVLGKRISAVHLHNCIEKNGNIEDHNVLESGIINIEETCKQIKKTSCKFLLLEITKKNRKQITDKDFEKNLKLAKSYF